MPPFPPGKKGPEWALFHWRAGRARTPVPQNAARRFEEDISRSIRLMLETTLDEQVMRPDFGCGIREDHRGQRGTFPGFGPYTKVARPMLSGRNVRVRPPFGVLRQSG